jgi:hypothetical protein
MCYLQVLGKQDSMFRRNLVELWKQRSQQNDTSFIRPSTEEHHRTVVSGNSPRCQQQRPLTGPPHFAKMYFALFLFVLTTFPDYKVNLVNLISHTDLVASGVDFSRLLTTVVEFAEVIPACCCLAVIGTSDVASSLVKATQLALCSLLAVYPVTPWGVSVTMTTIAAFLFFSCVLEFVPWHLVAFKRK